MWASTCASSVDTLPVQMYQSTSKASRSAINANFASRGSLRIASLAVAGKDGVVSDAGVDCGGTGGGVGELIGAIFPSAVPLFGICVPHVAHSLGQIHSGLVETIEGVDLVRVRACQGVLSGDNFDVRGDSCCEAACGLRYFIVRELESKGGDLDVFAGGIKIVHRRLHFANDTRLQELAILRDTPLLQVCVSNFRMNPPTGKEWDIEVDLIAVRWNAIVEARALVKPVSGKVDLREALFRRRFFFQMRDSLLRRLRLHLRAVYQRSVDGRCSFNLRQVEELQFVGERRLLVARKIEQFGQDVVRSVCRSLRVDQILSFVLQLDLRASGVDVQAYSRPLQIRRLLVKTLGEIDPDFCGIVRGKCAEDQNILGYKCRGDIFARYGLFCTCFTNALARYLIPAK